MNPALQRKELIGGIVDLLSLGISHERYEDAETLLTTARLLRPNLPELDTFEAWIAMRRGYWPDAIRILRNVEATAPNWALGRALMAFCQFALGDSSWHAYANDVIVNGNSEEAANLIRLLMDPEGSVSDRAREVPSSPTATTMNETLTQSSYLRA